MKEKAVNIFKIKICGETCYIRNAEARIRAVNECNDISRLKAALRTKDLQKTVRSRIESKIKKHYKQLARNYMKNLKTNDPKLAKATLVPMYTMSKVKGEVTIGVGGKESSLNDEFRDSAREIIKGLDILIKEK